MDRIGLTPNFEGHVDLGRAINDIDFPTKGRDITQLGALGARIDCIRDIPVGRGTELGETETKKVEEEPLTRELGVGRTQCRK